MSHRPRPGSGRPGNFAFYRGPPRARPNTVRGAPGRAAPTAHSTQAPQADLGHRTAEGGIPSGGSEIIATSDPAEQGYHPQTVRTGPSSGPAPRVGTRTIPSDQVANTSTVRAAPSSAIAPLGRNRPALVDASQSEESENDRPLLRGRTSARIPDDSDSEDESDSDEESASDDGENTKGAPNSEEDGEGDEDDVEEQVEDAGEDSAKDEDEEDEDQDDDKVDAGVGDAGQEASETEDKPARRTVANKRRDDPRMAEFATTITTNLIRFWLARRYRRLDHLNPDFIVEQDIAEFTLLTSIETAVEYMNRVVPENYGFIVTHLMYYPETLVQAYHNISLSFPDFSDYVDELFDRNSMAEHFTDADFHNARVHPRELLIDADDIGYITTPEGTDADADASSSDLEGTSTPVKHTAQVKGKGKAKATDTRKGTLPSKTRRVPKADSVNATFEGADRCDRCIKRNGQCTINAKASRLTGKIACTQCRRSKLKCLWGPKGGIHRIKAEHDPDNEPASDTPVKRVPKRARETEDAEDAEDRSQRSGADSKRSRTDVSNLDAEEIPAHVGGLDDPSIQPPTRFQSQPSQLDYTPPVQVGEAGPGPSSVAARQHHAAQLTRSHAGPSGHRTGLGRERASTVTGASGNIAQSLINLRTQMEGYLGEIQSNVADMHRLERCVQETIDEIQILAARQQQLEHQDDADDDEEPMDQDREVSPEV